MVSGRNARLTRSRQAGSRSDGSTWLVENAMSTMITLDQPYDPALGLAPGQLTGSARTLTSSDRGPEAGSAAAATSFLYRRFHLVVHHIGGPVGFELAAVPGRVASLTLLNTTIDVTGFKSPWIAELALSLPAGPSGRDRRSRAG